MDPQNAIDLCREALKTCIMVGGPILLASLLIGLLVSVLQAMTQLHDQTISFVPKILMLLLMIGLCLPWLSDRMQEFAKSSFEKPMIGPASYSGSYESSSIVDRRQPNVTEQANHSLNQAPVDKPIAYFAKATSQAMGNGSSTSTRNGMPSLQSPRRESNQPQLRPNPEIQSRIESPFATPGFRFQRRPRSDSGG